MPTKTHNSLSMSYKDRIPEARHPLARRLFEIMESKKTNLAFNPDVTSAEQFLELTDVVGPHICILKSHIDIIADFDSSVIKKLQVLAEKHQFLLFEDRKFIDIGSVVAEQYRGGVYQIADWAHIVNATHILPGPGVVQGLAQVGIPKGRGLFLLTEMSSKGALKGDEHKKSAVDTTQMFPDFVMGYICQTHFSADPGVLHITPGVQLARGGDDLGQQYRTPHQAIVEQGNDIIIVGRGIYGSENPASTAQLYQTEGWKAYQERIGS